MVIEQEKINIAAHLIDNLIARFKVVNGYPTTEEARRAASAFRAAAPPLFMEVNLDDAGFDFDALWVDAFWAHISGFAPFIF